MTINTISSFIFSSFGPSSTQLSRGVHRLLSSSRVWSSTWCMSRFSSLAWASFSKVETRITRQFPCRYGDDLIESLKRSDPSSLHQLVSCPTLCTHRTGHESCACHFLHTFSRINVYLLSSPFSGADVVMLHYPSRPKPSIF